MAQETLSSSPDATKEESVQSIKNNAVQLRGLLMKKVDSTPQPTSPTECPAPEPTSPAFSECLPPQATSLSSDCLPPAPNADQ